jgi:hypothetical protein
MLLAVSRRRLCLIALAVLVLPGAAAAAKLDVAQWTFVTPADAQFVTPKTPLPLRNGTIGKSLKYQSRDYGINLGWDTTNTAKAVSVERQGSDQSPIRYGERIAIRVQGGGYLRYKEREYGINLVWSSTPVYEFELTGGLYGARVRAGTPFGIYDTEHGDYVVYGSRTYGINLRWFSDAVSPNGGYPPLPVPPEFRGPSGEPGQILLQGRATKSSVFHGGTDDELDWHVYMRLAPSVRRRLYTHLLRHGDGAKRAHVVALNQFTPLREDDLNEAYCEFMVVDGYKNTATDERWYSADVTQVLMLPRSAWSYSAKAASDQNISGSSANANDSRLVKDGVMVYQQGAFVNDKAHRFKVELHPLDSIAYALDASGKPLTFDAKDTRWPADKLTWRVAAFTNSTWHRIDGADYLKKDRRTTWYLPLPQNGYKRGYRVDVKVASPGFTNHALTENKSLSSKRPRPKSYSDYGVKSVNYGVDTDLRESSQKLRVSIVMAPPDRWGGMFFMEFQLTAVRG